METTTTNTRTDDALRRKLLTEITGKMANSTPADLAYFALYVTGIKYGAAHPKDKAAAWYLEQIQQTIENRGHVDTVKALTLDLAEYIAERTTNG